MDEFLMFQDRVLEEMKLQSALKNRTVFINKVLDEDNIFKTKYLIERIVKLDEKEKTPMKDRKHIILKISSPGGLCGESLSLISLMERLKEQGYIIETHSMAHSASMAFVLMCCGSQGYRFAEKHSELMCHQILQFKYGYYNLQEDLENLEHSIRLWDRIKNIIIQNTAITMEQLNDITIRKFDWYMWSEEALQLKVIDHII